MAKNATPLRYKIMLAFGSLLFFLLLLEIGLRLAGWMLQPEPVSPDAPPEAAGGSPTDTTVILCVGDSFTHGGRVEEDDTYPALLQKKLNHDWPEWPARVINQGVCESNTSLLRRELPNWLETYRPDVVILLNGSANRFNPLRHPPIYPQAAETAIKKVTMPDAWWRNLRVIKAARLIDLNLQAREASLEGGFWKTITLQKQPDHRICDRCTRYDQFSIWLDDHFNTDKPYGDDPLGKAWRAAGNHQYRTAIETLESIIKTDAADAEVVASLAAFHFHYGQLKLAASVLDRPIRLTGDVKLIAAAKAFVHREMAERHMRKMEYDAAIGDWLQYIRDDPMDHYGYYRMAKAYPLQSRYDAKTIIRNLDELADGTPGLRENEMFLGYYKQLADWDSREEDIRTWIETDLAAIADLIEKSGAKLIVQTYPIDYPVANGLLKELAKKRGAPLVDNLSAFANLGPRDRYLFDDDHCTGEGHRVMVENIYKTLRELYHRQP